MNSQRPSPLDCFKVAVTILVYPVWLLTGLANEACTAALDWAEDLT